ncbi:phosphoribosylglycinamide formyltransferase [Roseospirillum parvum]|uniref:Phosphoribosylglycinamide formyltransferase n=1 Tax=Roseospirillum parvum TaxID=83401 RepID=A0A1G7VXV0_9PROT|nr:phosphoribosylglycinamide formyltransferase [Roseospirillum parvum]SDG64481.1 phosphoribosylglycinamide formyltransferase-1 [Roseospirillum parvum]
MAPDTRRRVAILVSGRGSNMDALLKAAADPAFPARVVLVLSNRPNAPALDKARAAGVPTEVLDHTTFDSREAFDQALDERLRAAQVELVCLAGFLRLLTERFVDSWENRLINIHPSLLPAFKGLHTHERALETGVRVHGCTVHFLRPAMDEGPIIAQAAVAVLPDDTAESLGARVLEAEHQLFPLALRLVAEGRARVRGERVDLTDTPTRTDTFLNPPVG